MGSSMLNCGYEFLSIDTQFGICCFPAMHTALSKNKDGFARNRDNVSEWSDPRSVVSVNQHYKGYKADILIVLYITFFLALIYLTNYSLLHCTTIMHSPVKYLQKKLCVSFFLFS